MVNAPAGKRLAPILGELVPVLRQHGELDIDEGTAALLIAMSAATIDRRLAFARSTLVLKGRSHTKPGSLLKSRISMRTWADHDENTPGFVERVDSRESARAKRAYRPRRWGAGRPRWD